MNLNIVSFNIRCCDDKNGNSIPERAPRLNKIMADYDIDLIGFQEFVPRWEEFIKKDFGDKYEFFNKYRAESNLESVPMLWNKEKFECIKRGYFWLSDTPETESKGWDELYDCYRICIYAVLKEKKSGKCFTFINTHFGFGDGGQTKSAKLIYEYSKKISSYPTFVTGDFNMKPDSPAYKLMSELFTDVNAVTANDLRTTYHGYEPEKITDSHIDYCFISKDIKPVNQKIMDEMIDGKFPSDHYGIYVTIEL